MSDTALTGDAPAGDAPSSAGAPPSQVLAAETRRRSAIRFRLRERLRNSLLVVPVGAIVAGLALSELVMQFDVAGERFGREEFGESLESIVGVSASSVQSSTAAIATAMLTFMGVVFALTILALQMASSQFSPRVMSAFVRSRMTKLTMGMFMATFTYSLDLLASIEPGNDNVDAFLPAAGYAVLLGLVIVTLFVFVAYVNRVVQFVRVGRIVESVLREARASVDNALVPPGDLREVAAPARATPLEVVAARRAGVLGGIDVRRLTRLADRYDAVLVLRAKVGDYVCEGEDLIEVHGAASPPASAVVRAVFVGTERTMFEDPWFGVRQLVDIAVRALSPGVNDPTTAVQAVDRLTDLLVRIGSLADPPRHYLGSNGTVRLVRPVHDWESAVSLAFTEIRRYGADSPQIPRRLLAAIDSLVRALDDSRHPPLVHQRELLLAAIGEVPMAEHDRRLMQVADSSGLG